MSIKDDVREFLISRRANITPEQAGLPAGGTHRRVPGLRREEVAILAGVSIDYYTKLERGKIQHASESVLGAIARALQLDEVEREHLFDLARAAGSTARAPKASTSSVRISVQRMLDSMTIPAVGYNPSQDLIASNLLGKAMFAPHFEAEQPNMARFIFLDSRARDFYGDWDLACSLTAAMLRYEAGRNPLSSELTALIGELSTRSPQFRQSWSERDVHEHRTGNKTIHHPEVGELNLTYDVLELPGEHGLAITTYTAGDSSSSIEKLALLASWAVTHEVGTPNPTSGVPQHGPS
jgi:transcriptional regulator with XRE-family HTH domain